MRSLLALFLVPVVAAAVQAQPKEAERKPGDAMIEAYLAAEADRLSQKVLDGATTLEEWKEKWPRLEREYLDMLGLQPLPEKTPLHATVTGTLEKHGVLVEKLHFQSRPGLYVTANLYRPLNVEKKLPAILYVCGHADKGRDGNKSAYQQHGFWFANNGYVCLMLDTLQLGEIRGIHHGTYGIRGTDPAPTRFWWHSAGYTPAGVECWNGIRALDYLQSRPEVDPDRLGVTGISGGGATTFWIAAADPRVKAAVPVSGMSDLESYVKNKVINRHCDCMFLYNTYGWDWTTIAALIAPRPLLFANSDEDPIFPMDGNRRVIAKLRKLYAMYGKPDLVEECVSHGGHAYRPDLRVAIYKFLNKHLKGDTTTPVQDADYALVAGKELRAFPEDSDLPMDAINAKIDETFVPRGKVELPKEGKFAEWKKEMIGAIQKHCFPEAAARWSGKAVMTKEGPLVSQHETEKGIVTTSLDLGDLSGKNTVLVDVGEVKRTDESWYAWHAKHFPDGCTCYQPRGATPELAWTKKSPPNYVERSHLLLGETVDGTRLRDVILFARTSGKERGVKLAGQGTAGVLGAYAALLEPSIQEVVVVDPPTSHKSGPHFLGILRILDIPEALGLLAPKPLTIVGDDPAFDRTAEIYRLAGASDKLKRVKR